MLNFLLYFFVTLTVFTGMRANLLKKKFYDQGLQINPLWGPNPWMIRKARKNPNNQKFLKELSILKKATFLNLISFLITFTLIVMMVSRGWSS